MSESSRPPEITFTQALIVGVSEGYGVPPDDPVRPVEYMYVWRNDEWQLVRRRDQWAEERDDD